MDRNKKGDRNLSQAEILKLPYLVLVFSLLFTIGATYIFYKNEESKDLARFQSEIDRCKNRIDSKLRAYVGLLKAGRGFVEANDQINRNSFSSFVGSLEVEKNYPEITQIGFSKRVGSTESGSLTEKMRAENYSNFKIFPALEGNERQPIIYIEPDDSRNLSVIGLDMLSNSAYRAAMDQARKTGETAITGKLDINLSNEEKKTGFMIFMPIYKGGGIPVTAEERENLLIGFIYDSIDANAFLKDAQNVAGVLDLTVAAYENQTQPENLIAQTGNVVQGNGQGMVMTSEVSIAGKKWIIAYQTLPAFESQSGLNWTPIIFVIGIIFSLILFGTTYLESYARAKAEKITRDLQESEKEKGFLLEREQKARRTAEESSHAKDEFISIVSHELRTPLNSIAGWTRILHTADLPDSTRIKALQTIDKNVRLQTGIVENLLDLSQMLSGAQCLVKDEVILSEVFEAVYAEIEPAAKAKKVDLIKESDLGAQKINADKEKLKQIFKNLLSNAIKFTPQGGQISARLKKKDEGVEIKIADTGQGIKPEVLPSIFEDFKQADSSITRIHGGLGLGLAIVRRIVELHGGRISAFSEGENKGTEFTIKLPLISS